MHCVFITIEEKKTLTKTQVTCIMGDKAEVRE